jgi:hypothetical protein
MDFTPKDEKDLIQFELLPDNTVCDFDVLSSEDKRSKNGNDMIEINVGIYVEGKIRQRIFDYLLPLMEAKLRHFCDTTGLLTEYESGTLTAVMCRGRSGKCRIGIQKDKNGEYPDKNIIKDYVCRPAKSLNKETKTVYKGRPDDDDIPF